MPLKTVERPYDGNVRRKQGRSEQQAPQNVGEPVDAGDKPPQRGQNAQRGAAENAGLLQGGRQTAIQLERAGTAHEQGQHGVGGREGCFQALVREDRAAVHDEELKENIQHHDGDVEDAERIEIRIHPGDAAPADQLQDAASRRQRTPSSWVTL